MKQQEMPSAGARVKATLCQQPLPTALETGADRHLCSLPSGSLLSEKEDVCGSIVGLLGPLDFLEPWALRLLRSHHPARSTQSKAPGRGKVQTQKLAAAAAAKLLQSCPILCDPMDSSPPGSSVHGDSPGKNTGVGCYVLLQMIFLTQESNLRLVGLLHWQAGSYH